ncbi:hypothetical protein ACFX1Q_030128 [Malus domestica]
MFGPSNRHFDLNLGEEAVSPSPDNIWPPSFISATGLLTVGDSMMKNDMTAAVVARNLVTPKDNRLLAKQSDELTVKDSLALSVQCAVMSLKQEIRGLKHENKQLHMLAHNYAINMKMKIDQMQESDGQILLDYQRFVAPNDQPLMPPSSGAPPTAEAPPTTETSPKQPL